MSSSTFYSSGKLLISSEYFILDGAQGLALPTIYGQRLTVDYLATSTNTLFWKAYTSRGLLWLDLVFDTKTFHSKNDLKEAQLLSLILQKLREQEPTFLVNQNDVQITTNLEFPNEWGLGSSSTLLACLAQWTKVDWFSLLRQTMGGSGYDVACGIARTPILYCIEENQPTVKSLFFQPKFSHQLYFAYLGKKQLSSKGIQYYKEHILEKQSLVLQLTQLTHSILTCTDIDSFEHLLETHETLISNALNMEKVQNIRFPDYWGTVKSLGAWGGDFVLLTNRKTDAELRNYLQQKNIDVVFSFDELILKS